MEEEFVEATLNTLPANELLEIFKRMSPESIVNLCRTNVSFNTFCQDDVVWIELMKEHFSYFNATLTPKKQYEQIVLQMFTYYHFVWFYEIEPDVHEAIVGRVDDTDPAYLEARIRGLAFERDTYMWVTIELIRDMRRIHVFRTKDQAVNYTIEVIYLELIHDLRIYADNEFGNHEINTINQAAEDYGLPVPFSDDNVEAVLRENQIIIANDPIIRRKGGHDIRKWYIREILFRAE